MIIRLSAAGVPPWKVGLIPILLAVLFKVTRTSSEPELEPNLPAAAEETAVASATTPSRPTTVLPDLSLADALQFDPFTPLPAPERLAEVPPSVPDPSVDDVPALPAQPSTPAVNPLVEKAATLKQLKVSAVFHGRNGAMAIIDSRTVRAGDVLSPGVRVVEIRGTDVILRVENGEPGPASTGVDTTTR